MHLLRHSLATCATLICCLAALSGCTTNTTTSKNSLAAELAGIRSILPGTYTGPSPAPWDASKTVELEHVFAEIDAPQFGELVYYYQLSANGRVMQQKLFGFDTDPARTRNAMQPNLLSGDLVPANLHTQPELWSTIDVSSVNTFPEGCAISWQSGSADAEWRYSASSLPKTCRFSSAKFEGLIKGYIRYDVNADGMRWAERLVSDAGKLVAQTANPLRAARMGQ